VSDDTGGDGAWDRPGSGYRAWHAASVADLVRDRAQDRGRRRAGPQPAAPATVRCPHEQADAGDCTGGDRASGGGERRASGPEKSSPIRERQISQQAAKYFAAETIW